MASPTKPAVIALTICGVLDLIAAPALLADASGDSAKTIAGVSAAILGVLTLLAAAGLAKGARWAKSTAIGSRVLDVATALPGIGAGAAAAAAIGVVTVVSIVTIVLVVRAGKSALQPSMA